MAHILSTVRTSLIALEVATERRWSIAHWRYCLVVLCAAFLLLARQPSQVSNPQLVYEDGTVFFTQALNLRTFDALVQVYAGYWHLIPRLIAETGSLLPIAAVPLFYNLSALLLTSVAMTWFYLPHFRHIVANDWLRLVFVLLLVTIPQLDGLMMISYVQWYIALWGTLVAVMHFPRYTWQQWAIAVVYLLALGTAPILLVLLPVWVLRYRRAGNPARYWIGVVIAGSVIMGALVALIPRPPMLHMENLTVLVIDVVRGICYKIFMVGLLGRAAAAELLARFGWPAAYLIAAAVIGGVLFVLAHDPSSSRRRLCLVLIYIGVAATTLYFVRAEEYKFMFATSTDRLPAGTARYFLIGTVTLYLLLLIQADRWLRRRRVRWWLALLWAMLIALHVPSFRLAAWPDGQWPTFARLLTYLTAEADSVGMIQPLATAERTSRNPPDFSTKYPVQNHSINNTPRPAYLAATFPANIPLVPASWKATLFLSHSHPGVYTFPEGVRLLGVAQSGDHRRFQIDLFWQGNPLLELRGDEYYTAFAHIVDDQGQELVGHDVELRSDDAERSYEDVFVSEHTTPIPPELAAGRYDLVVGLYSFDNTQLVPSSSILIKDAIEIDP